MFKQDLFTYLVRAMVLLTAIPIHECAHAWASDKLGDRFDFDDLCGVWLGQAGAGFHPVF